MRRIAQRVFAVGLQAGHPAARAGQPGHLSEDLGGIGDRHQQGAAMHQVKGIWGQPGVPGVGLNDLNGSMAGPVYAGGGFTTVSRPMWCAFRGAMDGVAP